MQESRFWRIFNCKRCGVCCQGIELPYDPESIFEIADYFGISVKETIKRYYGELTDDGFFISQNHKRQPCPFLDFDSDNKAICKIYPVRPYGCRDFPFETMGTLDCPEARKIIEKSRQDDA